MTIASFFVLAFGNDFQYEIFRYKVGCDLLRKYKVALIRDALDFGGRGRVRIHLYHYPRILLVSKESNLVLVYRFPFIVHFSELLPIIRQMGCFLFGLFDYDLLAWKMAGWS